MKKSQIWAIIGCVILIALAIIIAVTVKSPSQPVGNSDNTTSSQTTQNDSTNVQSTANNTGSVTGSKSPLYYACQNNKTIVATFTGNTATLKLSDGRTLYMTKTDAVTGNEYQYKQNILTIDGTSATITDAGSLLYSNCIVTNSGTNESLAVFTDKAKTFTFSYPKTLSISAEETPVSGPVTIKVTITKDSQPKTNLGDSTFIVTADSSKKAVDSCLVDPIGNLIQKSSVTINGTKFTKLTSTDAAAGNRYEVATYVTVKNNVCYNIKSTIHWSVIENYAPSMGIKNFDKTKVQNTLNSILNSFKFL